jgi:DNA-binding GntR family transcriptional regulator
MVARGSAASHWEGSSEMSTRRKRPAGPIRSLRREVYEHLRLLMNQGRLRPGHYLDLNAIALEIGISRTPLRDALLRLESEGFVEILNRRGVRVRALTLETIRNLYQILGALESSALRIVAPRLTPEVWERMRQLNSEMSAALDDSSFERYYDANLSFHNAYLDMCCNEDMIDHIRILKERLYDFPRLKGFVPEWERASLGEHQAIIECLEDGKSGAAADLLRDVHWSYSYQEPYILKYYAAAVAGAAATAP